MKNMIKPLTVALVTALLFCTNILTAGDGVLKSTPVGSWQLRQMINTDEKGKQTLQEMRTSLVGQEKRGKTEYLWVEIATDSFKMKKGQKGKQIGEHTVVKILMEKSLLQKDPEDVFSNLQGLGEEIIMQSGDQDPVKIEAGGMMSGMMQSMGPEIDYSFKKLGDETIEVPAGKIKCKVVEGEGSVEMKIVFKTIHVDSKSKQWTSDKVPFGIVRMDSVSITSGKESKMESVLLAYGDSGAKSEIKGQPQSMKMPSLGDIFGS